MTLVLIIFLFILSAVCLIFAIKAKVVFSYDINEMSIKLSLLWLYPFLKADIGYMNSSPVLTILLFNKSIYNRKLQVGKQKAWGNKLSRLDIVRSAALSDVDVQAAYGFASPFATGMACGILGIVFQYVDIDSFEQSPDFLADDEYVHVRAEANLNIGLTALNLIKAFRRSSIEKLHTQA